jgi:hypothetical protein
MKREALLTELRKLAKTLPETRETAGWGHPTFKAGKRAFAVLDHYEGADCLCAPVGRGERARRLRDPRYFAPPYDRAKTWIALPVARIRGVAEARELCLLGYREVALERMLRALPSRYASWARRPDSPSSESLTHHNR